MFFFPFNFSSSFFSSCNTKFNLTMTIFIIGVVRKKETNYYTQQIFLSLSLSGGHATFFSFLNSFIHVIMYTYYGLAAIGPHMNKYLGWKRYLTALQMIQFVAIFTHSFQLLFRECNFPSAFMAWIGGHGILFLFLFSDFYKKTYTKKSSSSSSSSSPAKMLTISCKPNDTIESLKRALNKRLD